MCTVVTRGQDRCQGKVVPLKVTDATKITGIKKKELI